MQFHVSWHRAPANASSGQAWADARGRSWPTVQQSGAELFAPWEISFETAIAVLEALPHFFCEWDGAWVWHPARNRQVEGVLYDRDGRLAYVDVQGDCLLEDVDQLAQALNPSGQPLNVQMPREGIVLAWDVWRQLFWENPS